MSRRVFNPDNDEAEASRYEIARLIPIVRILARLAAVDAVGGSTADTERPFLPADTTIMRGNE